MKRAAVFFDRDNTLILSDGYLGNPAEVKLVDGAAEAIARARRLGFACVTVSNQSGVARGLFTEDAVRSVNRRMDDLLKLQIPTAVIDAHEFCPFHPDATVAQYKHDSDLRKPKPGMLLRAAQNLALDLARSWMVGDAPRDIEAGQAAGCRTILVTLPDTAQSPSPATREPLRVEPDFTVNSLSEALDIIERHATHRAILPEVVPGGAAPATLPNIPPPAAAPLANPLNTDRLEHLLEEVLVELKRRRPVDHAEFSIAGLFAGIVQVFAITVMVYGYFANRQWLGQVFLFAIFLQLLVIALLITGRQR